MSKIRSKSRLEEDFCKYLSGIIYKRGLRYRRNYRTLPGKPDIVFVKYKIAIFLDGDFWHGYKLTKLGKTVPRMYWLAKILRNMERDKQDTLKLKKLGWTVMRFWEFKVRKQPEKVVAAILKKLHLQLKRSGYDKKGPRPMENGRAQSLVNVRSDALRPTSRK